MLPLIPEWAHHYGEFWRAIRIRNLWIIRLRYAAVFLLLTFLVAGKELLNLNFNTTQVKAIVIISSVILIYNIVIHAFRLKISCDPKKFNCLHTSLIMMILDLIALTQLVYFTGAIVSPLMLLFVFHMIIGSLVLPAYILYITAGLISLSLVIISILEHNLIIPSHQLFLFNHSDHPLSFEVIFLSSISFVLFVSVYLTNHIIRQLYKREQELRSLLIRLHDAEKSKQKYTISVVHEIKSPVTAIKSIIDLILDRYIGPINEELEKKLLRISARSYEALELINDILKFSKVKLIETRIDEEIIIENLIQKIIDHHSEEVKEKNAKVNFTDNRTEKITLRGDSVLIEMALSNIIANAIKYSNEFGIVEILLSDTPKQLEIEISDNGIGIPQKELAKIFDQFYRASNVEKTLKEGSGMGLSIVKEIVAKHNGIINVQSPSNIGTSDSPGTSFLIKIPYRVKGRLLDDITQVEYF